MDITFYDRTGRPIAYTSDGKHIFTFRGKAVAYVDKDSVYSYSGAHLGRFVDGWVRDNGGRCVFFTENARGRPLLRPSTRPQVSGCGLGRLHRKKFLRS